MRIKPGYGYYDVTLYPLGGDFKRAHPERGLVITKVVRTFPAYHGCDTEGLTATGDHVCFARIHLETE